MRTIILWSVVCLATVQVACVSGKATLHKKPNIMIFLVDDMGLMDTSVPFLTDQSGQPKRFPLNHWYRTPNMERLAAQGIRFSDFYSHTVCSPTRISLLTGQNSARHGTTNWIDPREDNGGEASPSGWNWKGLTRSDVTLPKILQTQGYRTIHVGKAHFGPEGSDGENPLNLGFELNVAGHSWGAPGSYYAEKNYSRGKKGDLAKRDVPHLEKYHGTKTFLTEALTLEAKAKIDEAIEGGQPFFLHMSHYAVHTPFQSDPRFAEHYRSDAKKDKSAQAFATLIEGMDKSLGDLMDHLKQRGIAENTLILFLGDNGSDAPLGDHWSIASSEPLRGRKGQKTEGGIRAPFIAAWAAPNAKSRWQKKLPIAEGQLQKQMATCYDLFPTVLALIDAEVPKGHTVDGHSLLRVLTGKKDRSLPEAFLSHFPHPRRDHHFSSYRLGDWKVIYNYFPEMNQLPGHYELYHLKSDPSESDNLANQSPKKLKIMMEALVKDLRDKKALYPVKDGKVVMPKIPDNA